MMSFLCEEAGISADSSQLVSRKQLVVCPLFIPIRGLHAGKKKLHEDASLASRAVVHPWLKLSLTHRRNNT